MKNNKQTSPKVAKIASKILKDGRTSKDSKSSAGSALSQAGNGKQTSIKIAKTSSNNLKSKTTSKNTKKVSGSALSQTKK